jgi:hypothetical protein
MPRSVFGEGVGWAHGAGEGATATGGTVGTGGVVRSAPGLGVAADTYSVERSESRGGGLAEYVSAGWHARRGCERQRALNAHWRGGCLPEVTCDFVVMLPRYSEGTSSGEGPSLLGGSCWMQHYATNVTWLRRPQHA